MSNHIKSNVNAIMEDLGLKVKTKVDEVKSSMEEVYKVLVKIGVVLKKVVSAKEKEEKGCYFHYHAAYTRHTIQECEDFKKIQQVMMD